MATLHLLCNSNFYLPIQHRSNIFQIPRIVRLHNKNEVNKDKEQAEELNSNKLIENNDVILCNGKSKTLVLDKNNCISNIIDVKNNKIKVDIKESRKVTEVESKAMEA